MRIDFNCDLGEGCGDDAAIVPLITSASIACGAHAGDEDTMRAAQAQRRTHGRVVAGVRATGDGCAGDQRNDRRIVAAAFAQVAVEVDAHGAAADATCG